MTTSAKPATTITNLPDTLDGLATEIVVEDAPAKDHDECQESYWECTRSRQARVDKAIMQNPDATVDELATIANVTRRTILRTRKRNQETVTPVTSCGLFQADEAGTSETFRECEEKAIREQAAAKADAEARGIHFSDRPIVEIKILARNEWQTKALENEPTNSEEATLRYYTIGWEIGAIEQRFHELKTAQGKVLEDAKRFFPNGKGWKTWLKSHKTCPGTSNEINLALHYAGYSSDGVKYKEPEPLDPNLLEPIEARIASDATEPTNPEPAPADESLSEVAA